MGQTEHRVTIRKGARGVYLIHCPRCRLGWMRTRWIDAIVKADTHLQHNHPPAPLSIGAWKR